MKTTDKVKITSEDIHNCREITAENKLKVWFSRELILASFLVSNLSSPLTVLFVFQIFYPETTDVYDRKNIPRMIYCIHALR